MPTSLLAVSGAGLGVKNVPLAGYNRRGIVAFNTLAANANVVKELVMACMLLAMRGMALSNEVKRMKICARHWSELTIFLYVSRRWMRPGIWSMRMHCL